MNGFKKAAGIIAATAITCAMGLTLAVSADDQGLPSGTTYVEEEPSTYVAGQRNAGDTLWTGNGTTMYKRHKNTNDSIYVYNMSGTTISYVLFWGVKSTGNYKYCCASMGSAFVGPLYSSYGSIPASQERWVINYVNERGCSYACVRFDNGNGKWSPDCYGTYPICNPATNP